MTTDCHEQPTDPTGLKNRPNKCEQKKSNGMPVCVMATGSVLDYLK
jgi:hypothetical protein